MSSEVQEIIEWECDTVRLVKLVGLARHPNFPYSYNRGGRYVQRPERLREGGIETVYLHQLAGPFKHGQKSATDLAEWCSRNPKFNEHGKRIGGGRGWPGAAYPFHIPFFPDVVDGKAIAYRLWEDDWHTWHTGAQFNKRGTAVGLGGMLITRKAPKWSAKAARDPNPVQFACMETLVLDYLLPRYGLTPEEGLSGHFEAGKPTCPGDVVEAWVRMQRGERVDWLEPGRAPWDDRFPSIEEQPAEDRRSLDTWTERQQALLDLGYDLGKWGADGKPGYYTRSALEAFQENAGIIVDGVYGPQTEKALRQALAAL